MHLRLAIKGEKLLALVDSGSAHNFVSKEVASRLGLALVPRPGLRVSVANGDRMSSAGLCSGLQLSVG